MHLGSASHVMCLLIPLSSGIISVPNTKLFQTAAAYTCSPGKLFFIVSIFLWVRNVFANILLALGCKIDNTQ